MNSCSFDQSARLYVDLVFLFPSCIDLPKQTDKQTVEKRAKQINKLINKQARKYEIFFLTVQSKG